MNEQPSQEVTSTGNVIDFCEERCARILAKVAARYEETHGESPIIPWEGTQDDLYRIKTELNQHGESQ